MQIRELLHSLGMRGTSWLLLPTAGFPTPDSGRRRWGSLEEIQNHGTEAQWGGVFSMVSEPWTRSVIAWKGVCSSRSLAAGAQEHLRSFYVRNTRVQWTHQIQQLTKSNLVTEPQHTQYRNPTPLVRWWHLMEQGKMLWFTDPLYIAIRPPRR